MFENISLLGFQQYWWAIIALLAAILVFFMFVQGGQTFLFQMGKTALSRNLLISELGHKWELTFTTLVTFGGAFFASFPLFYSTSFGGAYWVWILILLCFVIQAVSYEYRNKPNNILGRRTFDNFLFINGSLGVFLIGVAVATFFTGSEFSMDKNNITNIFESNNQIISSWKNPLHGLEALFNITNLLLGFSLVFLSRSLALLFFINRINEKDILDFSKKHLLYNGGLFLLFFLPFLGLIFTQHGFAVDPSSSLIYMKPYLYIQNILSLPIVAILLAVGILLVVGGFAMGILSKYAQYGFWSAGLGTILTVFSLLLSIGITSTSFYPSIYDLQSSLTIQNASSSLFTLKTMTYVSLFIPFVIAYIAYVWRALSKKKLTIEELKEEIKEHNEY